MENTQIFEMADRLKALQEQKKDIEAQAKALGAEIEGYLYIDRGDTPQAATL